MKLINSVLDKLFIVFGCIILIFILFVLVNHKSYLVNDKGIALYLALPISCVVGIFTAFFLPSGWRKAIFLSGICLIAALYAFETWLWFDETRDRLPSNADRRTNTEVVAELRQTGVAAQGYFSSQMISRIAPEGLDTASGRPVLPLGGVSNVLTVYCNDTGTWRTYQSGKYGFPNPRDAWKWENVEIIAVGDSFTAGACASEGREFVGLIRDAFPRTINLGTGGNGPLAELASLREYAASRQPKLVLWFYYENDLQKDLFREKKNSILMRYLEPNFSQNLADRQEEIDVALINLAKLPRDESTVKKAAAPPETSRSIFDFIRFSEYGSFFSRVPGLTLPRTRIHFGLVGGGGEWPDPETELFKRIMTTAKREVESWNGELVVVILPSWERVIRGLETKDRHLNEARTVFADLNLSIVDMVPVMSEHPDPHSLWPNRGLGHYGEAGHRLVAETVLQWLARANPKLK